MVPYPTSGLDHLELQRVSQGLISQQRHSVTAGQACEHVPWGQEAGLWDHLRKTSMSPLHHSPHIQTVLRKSSCLKKQGYSDERRPQHVRRSRLSSTRPHILTLSKQKTDTLAQMLMRGGLMQKTPCRFSLR